MSETVKESEKANRPSWLSAALDLVFRHARDVVKGAVAVAETIEDDLRRFVVRFVREMVLGIVFLFVGLGFIVFGIGVMLVEAFRLGPSAGPVVVGVLFVAAGSIVFMFSRK